MSSAGAPGKRMLDLALAGLGVLILSPVLLGAAVAVALDSPGPVFFRQTRVGRGFRPFRIFKFRTMAVGAERAGPLSVGADPRVTRVGRHLRRLKLDELPQLFNVLAGDMSLVGPRPELPEYVERFRADYAELLTVRPGMTDLASLKYRDESGVLAAAPDPADEYLRAILPDKIRLGREYVRRSSVVFDLSLILRTLRAVLGGRPQ